MLLLTTEEIPQNLQLVRTFGVVIASRNKALGLFKDKLIALKDKFGGTSGTLDKAVNQAATEAIKTMETTAKNIYKDANAIIGIRLDSSIVSMKEGRVMVHVFAYGTVARVEPKRGKQ